MPNIGLYSVQPAGILDVGELLVVWPPEPLASLFADHGYLPKVPPLLKRALALPGQIVCRSGVRSPSTPLPPATRDRRGPALPVWQGCRIIPPGEVLVMNAQSEDSLDGPLRGSSGATIAGRTDLL